MPFLNPDFLSLIWALPLVFVFHEMEEWGILSWYRRNFIDLPNKSDQSIRAFLVFASLFAFVWTGGVALFASPTLAAWLMLPLAALIFYNASQHVFWQFYFKQYAPGVFTSAWLLAPVTLYLCVRAVELSLVPIWYPVTLLALAVLGLYQTVMAGNRLTVTFYLIHRFGLQLGHLL
jgi:hypothetical protein